MKKEMKRQERCWVVALLGRPWAESTYARGSWLGQTSAVWFGPIGLILFSFPFLFFLF
jgi:hypothetical protein